MIQLILALLMPLFGTASEELTTLKLEGAIPDFVTEFEGSANFFPTVSADDLGFFEKKKCYYRSGIDLSQGKSFQLKPKMIRRSFKAKIENGRYRLDVPVSLEDGSPCKWGTSVASFLFNSSRTRYRPMAVYVGLFDPSNSNHVQVPLEETTLICKINNDIEDCGYSPQHVTTDKRTILISNDIDYEKIYNLDFIGE
ncbi:MAG: hypothetical protein KDD25_00660 [Bdellovibrionales bacterium]|nr:hypothetical protein [Bdellovibrionales bacterium]